MKIIILGDSISEGIGRKKINYTPLLEKKFIGDTYPVEILNLSYTGTTVKYPLENLQMIIATKPNIAIIMYGSVDVQIRPDLRKNKYGLLSMTPRRYKLIGGMLNPRPFCSQKFFRSKIDKLDNLYRFILKKILVSTQGTYQYMTCEEFESNYELLIESLLANNCRPVLVSTLFLDEELYPGSNDQYIKCNDVIYKLANKYNLRYIDVYKRFKALVKEKSWDSIYYSDHFHPNIKGYEVISELIYSNIKEIIK